MIRKLHILIIILSISVLVQSLTIRKQIPLKLMTQYYLLLIYNFVAVYRSIFMTDETTKLCMFKSPLCRPIINRLLATIAELSFAIFIGLTIENIYKIKITKPLFLIILIAQIFCWYGVYYDHPKLNAIEGSLWVLFVLFIVWNIHTKKFNDKINNKFIKAVA